MNIYSVLQSKPHNPHYLKRYYNFIIGCKEANVNLIRRSKKNLNGIYMESHHIAPKAPDLFPEYKSFKDHPWNKMDLTARQHFIAHHILWKAYGGSQVDAYWAMKRTSGNQERYIKFTSKVYSVLRDEFSIRHSERMTGNNWGHVGEAHHSYGKRGELSPNFGNRYPNRIKGIPSKMKGVTGEAHPLYGRTGEACAMTGRTGELHNGYGSRRSVQWKEERSIKYSGEGHPNWGKNLSPEHGTFIGTNWELKTAFPLQKISTGCLSAVVRKKANRHLGWRLVN